MAAIVIPPDTSALCQAIIRRAQADIPIIESPYGSNRSPEIDAMCRRFGVPLASYWCALWTASVWSDAGAEIPPTRGSSHPAKCSSWHEWALATGRFSRRPALGFASLYGPGGRAPAEHIGVCVVATTPMIMDFEGNTTETGYSRQGELTELKRVNAERLIGFVSPEPLTVTV